GSTPDGMSIGVIREIIDQLRAERYRFSAARRVYIPKKNGTLRPFGLPSWLDKLIGEVVRRLLEAYYEPQFPARSRGFRPGRCCHTALDEIGSAWTGATWFTEGDIADCFGSPPTTRSCLRSWTNASMPDGSCGWWATCCGRGIWRT